MILLTFLSCFLVFFFVKDQIASFQLRQIIVFLKCSVCVFISLRDCDRVLLKNSVQPVQKCQLHAVDSLNVKYELRSKKIKQFCIMLTFPNDISRFAT